MANEQPYTDANGVEMWPKYAADGTLLGYVPKDTPKGSNVTPVQKPAENPSGDQWWTDDNGQLQYDPNGRPPSEMPEGENTPPTGTGPQPPSSPGGISQPDAEKAGRIRTWYQQYLGRNASDQEVSDWLRDAPTLGGVEDAIKNSTEGKAYAAKQAPAGGGGATPGYDPNRLRDALMASGVPANAAELKKFIDAHPEFATGVTIGGSKGNKLYGPGGVFLADVIRGTSTSNPAWDWDTSTGTSGGAAGGGAGAGGIDESYLTEYPGDPFTAPPGSELPADPFTYDDFTYQDFQRPGDYQSPDKAAMEADPSYQFRKDQALGALQNSASGRGLTNSGGTIYDLLGTASQFASTEYGNIWDRGMKEWQDKYNTALTDYVTNRGNAVDMYTNNRNNAADIWSKKTGLASDKYTRARDEFDRSVKDFYDQRDSAWEKQYKMAALGAGVTTAQ